MASREGERRCERTRTLSDKGTDLLEQQVSTFITRLFQAHRDLNMVLQERGSTDTLPEKRTLMGKHVTAYKKHFSESLEYLDRVNTLDSKREAAAHILIRDSIIGKAEAVLRGLDVILRSPSKRHSMSLKSDVSDKFTSVSERTQSSSSSSLRLKQSMKLQAQKAELRFAQREAILKCAKAEMVFNQTNLDADLEILDEVKKAAVASAEYQALCQELGDMSDSDVTEGDISDMPDFQLSNPLLVGTQLIHHQHQVSYVHADMLYAP